MIIHRESHPLSGQTVRLKDGICHPQYNMNGGEFKVEDWWDRVTGGSWMDADGNPAALIFAIRSAGVDLPFSDEVVYGKFKGMGVIIHVSEISEELL